MKYSLEKFIAKVLARRYWDGSRDTRNVKDLSFDKYWNMSAVGWLGTARGVISAVKNPEHLENLHETEETDRLVGCEGSCPEDRGERTEESSR